MLKKILYTCSVMSIPSSVAFGFTYQSNGKTVIINDSCANTPARETSFFVIKRAQNPNSVLHVSTHAAAGLMAVEQTVLVNSRRNL